MLLHILGVPRETILSDFVLSTRYLNERAPATPAPATEAEAAQARLFAEVIRLQPRYIEAVFQAVDERYGSFDRYRREALHFSDADVAALRPGCSSKIDLRKGLSAGPCMTLQFETAPSRPRLSTGSDDALSDAFA